MSFAKIEPRKEFSDFPKTHYVRIKEGSPVRLRILDNEALMVHKHYIPLAKASVVCSGYNSCPVCISNKKLIDGNPGMKTNQIKGYYPRQTRYLVNVLNRTPGKHLENGDIVFPTNNTYPATYSKTGESLTAIEPKPANRVEVLERGVTLFSQLDTINETLTNAEGNPIGLWNYDIIISASGSGKDMVTTVTPNVAISDDINLEDMGLEKYDLSEVSLTLSPEDIEKLLRGVSLQDIFASHKVEEILENDAEEPDEEDAVDVDQTIAELFGE